MNLTNLESVLSESRWSGHIPDLDHHSIPHVPFRFSYFTICCNMNLAFIFGSESRLTAEALDLKTRLWQSIPGRYSTKTTSAKSLVEWEFVGR